MQLKVMVYVPLAVNDPALLLLRLAMLAPENSRRPVPVVLPPARLASVGFRPGPSIEKELSPVRAGH